MKGLLLIYGDIEKLKAVDVDVEGEKALYALEQIPEGASPGVLRVCVDAVSWAMKRAIAPTPPPSLNSWDHEAKPAFIAVKMQGGMSREDAERAWADVDAARHAA